MKTSTAQSPNSAKDSKTHRLASIFNVIAVSAASLALVGCGAFNKTAFSGSGSVTSSSSTAPTYAAGGGGTVAGTGALSVPTATAAVARITNGLQGNVSSTSGNFSTFLTQVRSNLPKVSDPTKATGYDQIQILSFGACSDLVSGKTPLMMSKYNVNPASSITANQAALVAAGVKMMDQYTGGLASAGPVSSQVSSIFSSLVTQSASVSTNTSTIAFMTVCTAANSAGTAMLGF